MYHLFFLIPDPGRAKKVGERWRKLLGDHAICMESPKDTCSVAAAIVGLTEKRIADLDELVRVLKTNGIDNAHIGSTLRAVKNYAALLNPQAVASVSPAPAVSAPESWWKRLFG